MEEAEKIVAKRRRSSSFTTDAEALEDKGLARLPSYRKAA
jgi:hypothetical protein